LVTSISDFSTTLNSKGLCGKSGICTILPLIIIGLAGSRYEFVTLLRSNKNDNDTLLISLYANIISFFAGG
jgi:hypothetical protein